MEDNMEYMEIPENSGSLLINEATSRFSGAVWYDNIQNKDVTLLGCGGINSWVALLLSRLNINRIVIYDPDIVELGNLSGQLYGTHNLGQFKVNAILKTIELYSSYYRVAAYNERFTEDIVITPIVICGFDNMQSRKIAYNAWLENVNSASEIEKRKFLFIDGRLSADTLQVFAIQGNDTRACNEYSTKWLFDDNQAEETICSFKQTSFMANMIASIIINIFVNFVANEVDGIVYREVPFFTSYSADNMFFKVEV